MRALLGTGLLTSFLLLTSCAEAEHGPPGAAEVFEVTEVDSAWQTVTHAGISVDVPKGWHQRDCGRTVQLSPFDGCGWSGPGLRLFTGIFDTAMDEGEPLRTQSNGRTLWRGYVVADEWTVLVVAHDKAKVRRSLASVSSAR